MPSRSMSPATVSEAVLRDVRKNPWPYPASAIAGAPKGGHLFVKWDYGVEKNKQVLSETSAHLRCPSLYHP